MIKRGIYYATTMLDSQNIQILMQLIESMDLVTDKIEKAYNRRDGEDFRRAQEEILDLQKKIATILV